VQGWNAPHVTGGWDLRCTCILYALRYVRQGEIHKEHGLDYVARRARPRVSREPEVLFPKYFRTITTKTQKYKHMSEPGSLPT
jgi:hypothetical protein